MSKPTLWPLAAAPAACAEVKLNGIFANGMVLQRERPVPVRDLANPGGKVTVAFAEQTKSVAADGGGKWLVKLDAMPASATPITNKTRSPDHPPGSPGEFRGPSVLWNGMVAPLLKFPIRGVLWYQGESNAYVGVADTYKLPLPALIKEWRAVWEQPDMPFIIYQIAPNRKPQTDPNENSGIAVLQEAPTQTALATPRTALVVTMDLGETDVHYVNKEPAAERGMQAALGLAYERKNEFSSPLFQSLNIEGNQAAVHFAHARGGLVAKDGPVSGFVVAGENHSYHFAKAQIKGDTVVVSSPQVPKPVAMR